MFESSRLTATSESFEKMSRADLIKLRLVAIRRGVWFRVLSRLERGLIDLTLKITRKVRSGMLATALHSIVRKVVKAFEGHIKLLIWQVGAPLARRLSLIAQKWGNRQAQVWSIDKSFMRFLAIMYMNNPEAFKT